VREADREQLDAFAGVVSEELGGALVGAYLFGSAVLGGLKARSDLDVLAVTSRRTTADEKRRLVSRLLALSGEPRHLELTVVARPDVVPWRWPPRQDLQYGDWWRDEFERGELEPWGAPENPDLAALLTMVLLADTPLVGPPPADVLDPVPADDLLRATAGEVDSILRDLDGDTRNVLLTLARIWSTAATGTIRSKDSAADWALSRLPPEQRPPLARARAVYLGQEEERWDDLRPRLRSHVDHVVGEIRRVTAQPA
jgi:streptomycin 3"-adenylyltransferase